MGKKKRPPPSADSVPSPSVRESLNAPLRTYGEHLLEVTLAQGMTPGELIYIFGHVLGRLAVDGSPEVPISQRISEGMRIAALLNEFEGAFDQIALLSSGLTALGDQLILCEMADTFATKS